MKSKNILSYATLFLLLIALYVVHCRYLEVISYASFDLEKRWFELIAVTYLILLVGRKLLMKSNADWIFFSFGFVVVLGLVLKHPYFTNQSWLYIKSYLMKIGPSLLCLIFMPLFGKIKYEKIYYIGKIGFIFLLAWYVYQTKIFSDKAFIEVLYMNPVWIRNLLTAFSIQISLTHFSKIGFIFELMIDLLIILVLSIFGFKENLILILIFGLIPFFNNIDFQHLKAPISKR